MGIRDLGYRAYEGERRPASENFWVLLRFGVRRIFASWIVILVVLMSFLGSLVGGVVVLVAVGVMMFQAQQVPPDALAEFTEPWKNGWPLADYLGYQVFWVVTLLTLRSGASVLAEDFTYKAFQFYFAKPVTPLQYLSSRILALAVVIAVVLFVPSVVPLGTLMYFFEEERLNLLLKVFPLLGHSVVIAIVMATVSVGVSSLSKSRALTMSAWALLFFIPHGLSLLVEVLLIAGGADVETARWAHMGSIGGLLHLVAEGLFGVEFGEGPRWFHAAPVLAALVAGAAALAWSRLRRAEVIT